MAIESEGNGADGSGGLAVLLSAGFGVVVCVADGGLWEDGGVELGGFGGLAVEPEAGGYVAGNGHFGRYRFRFGLSCYFVVSVLHLSDPDCRRTLNLIGGLPVLVAMIWSQESVN